MRILMIYPEPDQDKRPRFGFSYEMLTIATILHKQHTVTIRDYSCQKIDWTTFSDDIDRKKYDLILLECDSFALKRSENLIQAKKILSLIQRRVPVIVYGNYSYITQKQFDMANYTIIHNDINEIIALINQIDSAHPIPFIDDFNVIPHIDRRLLMSIDYYKENAASTLLQTAKGCENSCIFCQRKGWQKHYVPHSIEYVLEELWVLRTQNYHNIWIIDENFTFDLRRAKQLLNAIYQEQLMDGFRFFISSWANIDKDFLDLAKKCNVRIISFGIESGSKDILRFYRKNINIDYVPELIRYANSIGLFTVGNFILGAPMETDETIDQTFSLIRSCEFDQINIKILDYMIGSELYESLPQLYKIESHVFSCAESGLTSFPLKEMICRRDAFIKQYYMEHKEIIAKKIFQYGYPY